ncbi:MAG: hypothetical protein AAFP22_15170 [Planctomycetota bacterium]
MVPPTDVPDLVNSDEGENPTRAFALGLLVRVVVGVLLGVAVVDVLVGAFGGESGARGNASVMTLDPELGWTNVPNYAGDGETTNALGLRSPGIPADAPADEVRVVVCGASNTYGLAERDEDTWAPKLKALLAERAEPAPRVLNGGVQGYSLIQACRRAGRLIDAVEPDLVVVVLFPSRQALVDTSPALTWTRVGEHLVPTELVSAWPEALRGVPAAIHRTLMRSNLYSRYRAKTQFSAGVGPKLSEYILTGSEPPEPIRGPLEETRAELRELVDYAAEQGVELRFVVTVETRGANEEQWRTWLTNGAKNGSPPLDTPMDAPFDALAALIESAGGTPWDLRETLYAMCADWERNVNGRLHWSPTGHTMVAEDWARRIADEGLLETLSTRRAANPREAAPLDAAEGDAGR